MILFSSCGGDSEIIGSWYFHPEGIGEIGVITFHSDSTILIDKQFVGRWCMIDTLQEITELDGFKRYRLCLGDSTIPASIYGGFFSAFRCGEYAPINEDRVYIHLEHKDTITGRYYHPQTLVLEKDSADFYRGGGSYQSSDE